ncbi:MAG TPA: hypothetical protein DCM54_15940 [Gammaproteobacteria bacterium]|nr:hypothetical protein [Gammaproteobacteria bacterium]
MIEQILTDFHFLRPEWFYAVIPVLILYLLLKYRQSNSSNWEKAIDASLLPHLLDNPDGEISKSPLTLVFVAWLLAIVALAGPVWQKTEQPVHEREDALVILFDLTKSMYADDVKPTRLVRARRKLQDLLNMRDEGVTGLIVFAGDAHVVSPLTDDTATIISMIPAITPNIMPATGSQIAPALERAVTLFEDAGVASGRILIITDEIRDIAEAQSVARSHRFSYPISVMSVGSSDGAPIPLTPGRPNSGFIKDRSGNLVIARVDLSQLQDFATVAGGRFTPMTLTDEDIEYLLAPDPLLINEEFRTLERDFDIWHEEGPWLLLLLLPLASLAFRRGWVWSIALLLVLPAPQSYALEWADLWQTKDEQGLAALQKGDAERASSLFESPDWKGSALYRGQNFQDAAGEFANIETTDGRYNLGNAFAKQGRLEEAIEVYDEALALDPDNEDAAFNKKLVEDLLQQQQQQQNQDQQNQDQQDQEQQDQENQQNADSEQQDSDEQDQQQAQQDEQQQQEQQQQEKEQQQEQELAEEELSEEDKALDSEEEQALKQWLRRVPDDPGGLLRRKFQKQHEDRLREGQILQSQSGDW